MTSFLLMVDPSLTLSSAIRPGSLAETDARVRATTYPLAVTLELPALSPEPPAVSGVATTVSTVATLPRRQARNAPITRIRAMTPRITLRRIARLRLGGGASRLIRSLERSGCAGEVIGRNLREGGGEREFPGPSFRRSAVPLRPNHPAGDPISGVARRLALVVIRLGVNHHRGAVGIEQSVLISDAAA